MLDIYVKDKNNKWQIIDIFNDESVLMEFKTSDIKDLDKAFTTYTQDFSIPASSNNTVIFDFFFDTNTKHNKVQYYDCQLFVNGVKNRVGRLGVMAGQYENDRLKTYTVSFYSGLQPLKEKLGEDTLKDLDFSDVNFYWNITNVRSMIYGNNPNIKVPLISVNRLWNVGWGENGDITTNGISIGELRPCLSINKILEKIESKYDINIDFNIGSNVLNRLYIWCNKEIEETNEIPLIPNNTFVNFQSPPNRPNNDNYALHPTIFKTTKGFRVVETTTATRITNCAINFEIVNPRKQIDNTPYTDKLSIRLVELTSTNQIIRETTIEGARQGNGNYLFTGASFQNKGRTRYYEAYLFGEQSLTIGSYTVTCKSLNFDAFADTTGNRKYIVQRISSGNAPVITDTQIDFSKSLDYPIIDFLSGLVKTFNIKIIESKDNIYSMRWLNSFHQKPIDLTPYTDLAENTVESAQRYKKIIFTHNEEDYLRNEAFRELTGVEYGTEKYETDNRDLSEEFEVETGFNILSYFLMPNSNIVTSYGFDSDIKQIDPDTPTIFFANEPQTISAFKADGTQAQINLKYGNQSVLLSNYTPVQNTNGFDEVSTSVALTFNKEIFPIDGEVCESNLFSKYYQLEFKQMYSNNVYLNNFTCHLPPQIVNDITMENTIIIRDKKYSIYEMSIDIASGKSELKLMNFYRDFEDNSNLVYPPTFYASYDETSPSNFRYAINQGQNINENIGIAQYVIEYTNTNTGVLQQQTLVAVPMQSMTGLISSGNGTFNVRAKCISVDGIHSAWTNAQTVIVVGAPVQTIYPPTFYPYYDSEYSGKIRYNINQGMDNTVQPTHFRIEWIRTSNGVSQTTTIVAVQNQSMIGEITTGSGTFNVRAQCGVNGTYGQWTSTTTVTVP